MRHGRWRETSLVFPLVAIGVAVVVGLIAFHGCGRENPESAPPAPVSEPTAAVAKPSDNNPNTDLIFAGRPLSFDPLPCAAAILIEPETGTVLYAQNEHVERAPASIVKMTLELVVMHEVEQGRLALTDSVRVSAWASKIGGSQAYLAEGETFPVQDLLQAVTIHSANDACVALAEHIAGTSENFVTYMNQEVDHLHLENTRYVNVHGLDDEPGAANHSSAYDIAQIARELIRHQHVLEWSAMDKVPFRGGAFILENTNPLVGKFEGLDGLKTGFTEKAGFNLCATAMRRGMRLISVVLGCTSNHERAAESAKLLGAGFANYSLVPVSHSGAEIEGGAVELKGAKPKRIQAVAGRSATLIVSRPDERKIVKKFVPRPDLRAPLAAGDRIGTLQVLSGDQVLAEIPAVTQTAVQATGLRGLLLKFQRK